MKSMVLELRNIGAKASKAEIRRNTLEIQELKK